MAVVGKTRVSGTTYYVTFRYNGRKVWERAGTDKRQAQSLSRRRQKEVEEGTYAEQLKAEEQTIGTFAEHWLPTRKGRWSTDEERYMRRHVLSREWVRDLKMIDARPKHALRLVQELDVTVSEKTKKMLSPKTVSLLHGMLHTMFRDAVLEEIVPANPWKVASDKLQRKSRKRRSPYALEDIAKILACPDVHPKSRVFVALAFFTGMREGEICGRRFKDWDPSATPLGSLNCWSQYGDELLKGDEREAGERARMIPVLPMLATILTWWKDAGFELVFCRRPTPEDFIVPTQAGEWYSRKCAYDLFQVAIAKAGVANLTLHSTRHSFITHARRGGARAEVLEKVTHNAAGETIDIYTHWEWDPLCEAVSCFPLRAGDASGDVSPNDSLLLVAPPGVELRDGSVTVGNYLPPIGDDSSSEYRKTDTPYPSVTADCAARHQMDGSSARAFRAQAWLQLAAAT